MRCVVCLLFLAGCGSAGSAAPSGLDASTDGPFVPTDATMHDTRSDALPGDSATDAGSPEETGPPPCGTDPWVTYGHDAKRTSATDACIAGPLTLAFKYVPAPPTGKTLVGVYSAIAGSDAAFVAWSSQDSPYLGTSAVDRVDTKGTRLWTWNSGTDSNLGNWLTSALGTIIANEDGLYFLDPATGTAHSNGVDNWGFTAFDAQRIYAINSSHVDGPGIYVGAYDPTEKQLWTKNVYGTCRIDAADSAGGIAVDGTTLYYAPRYSAGTGVTLGFASGVYAFDGATGTPGWFQATTPASTISVGAGLVYLVEAATPGMEKLVARKETDGTVAWTVDLPGASAQAPVLAAGKVLTATSTSVVAYDAAKGGTALWTASVMGAATQLGVIDFSGGCAGAAVSQLSHPMTTLAAALGSSTLVVTASDGVHVLKLADGTPVWTGPVPQAPGVVNNPVLVGKRLFVEDGQAMYALDSP